MPIEKPVPLWRQLLAMLYDTFLVAPLLMANAFVLVALFGPTASVDSPAVPSWLIQITSIGVIATFFLVFWCKSGQTLGMQAWRVKLVCNSGRKLSIGPCLLRFGAAIISAAPLGMGYWWVLFHPQSRSWHDLLSKTHLQLVPKA